MGDEGDRSAEQAQDEPDSAAAAFVSPDAASDEPEEQGEACQRAPAEDEEQVQFRSGGGTPRQGYATPRAGCDALGAFASAEIRGVSETSGSSCADDRPGAGQHE